MGPTAFSRAQAKVGRRVRARVALAGVPQGRGYVVMEAARQKETSHG
jgi:hypothetical protein